jgi:hypothetical protein
MPLVPPAIDTSDSSCSHVDESSFRMPISTIARGCYPYRQYHLALTVHTQCATGTIRDLKVEFCASASAQFTYSLPTVHLLAVW